MTKTDLSLRDRVEALLKTWGTDAVGLPDKDTWTTLADLPDDQPITLVNFFKMNDVAAYRPDDVTGVAKTTGEAAFEKYAAVSIPSVDKVGGRFLMVAPYSRAFIGDHEDWDLVAVASYPNPSAVIALFELDEYRAVYKHRTAACRDQRVSLCLGG